MIGKPGRSGRKSAKPADDALMERLRTAAKRDDPAPKSTADNARKAFGKRGSQ